MSTLLEKQKQIIKDKRDPDRARTTVSDERIRINNVYYYFSYLVNLYRTAEVNQLVGEEVLILVKNVITTGSIEEAALLFNCSTTKIRENLRKFIRRTEAYKIRQQLKIQYDNILEIPLVELKFTAMMEWFIKKFLVYCKALPEDYDQNRITVGHIISYSEKELGNPGIRFGLKKSLRDNLQEALFDIGLSLRPDEKGSINSGRIISCPNCGQNISLKVR